MLHGSVYDTHVLLKKYEKMIFVRLNLINIFTKYVYLKYELTFQPQHTTIIVFYMKLCGTTINFYVHINFKVLKKVKHGKNVLVVHVLQIYAGKNQKTKNVGTWGTRSPTFLRFSFFEIFFSKSVKREQLAHFWHG